MREVTDGGLKERAKTKPLTFLQIKNQKLIEIKTKMNVNEMKYIYISLFIRKSSNYFTTYVIEVSFALSPVWCLLVQQHAGVKGSGSPTFIIIILELLETQTHTRARAHQEEIKVRCCSHMETQQQVRHLCRRAASTFSPAQL